MLCKFNPFQSNTQFFLIVQEWKKLEDVIRIDDYNDECLNNCNQLLSEYISK